MKQSPKKLLQIRNFIAIFAMLKKIKNYDAKGFTK